MFAQAKAHPTIQMLWKRSPFQRPFNKWCIAYFLAASSLADPLPQLTTMLKGLFRGWVSSVINEKANKDLRDAQIRDKPQKAQPFFLPPLFPSIPLSRPLHPVTSVTRESESRAT